MAVINHQIETLEKQYKTECDEIDVKADEAIERIKEEKVEKKEALATKMVNSICHKVLN